MRKILLTLKYLLLTVIFLIATGVLAAVIYKNEIINLLKAEVDNNIKTKLEVEEIELKLFKGFPNVSVEFKGVVFYSAFKEEALLKSENLYFMLNVLDLLQKDITVQKLEVNNAQIFTHINKQGEENYNVFIIDSLEKSSENKFEVKSIVFNNLEISTFDEVKKINEKFDIKHLIGSFKVGGDSLAFNLVSELSIVESNMDYMSLLLDKRIKMNISSSIANNKIVLGLSNITIENASFNLNGSLDLNKAKSIDIKITSNNLLFSDLASLLSDQWQQRIKPLKGKGEINVNTTIKGDLANSNWPKLYSNFELRNFELEHENLIYPIKNININGEVVLSDIHKIESGVLRIKDFNGFLNGRNLFGSATIKNFRDPKITVKMEGGVDFNWVLSLTEGYKKNEAEGNLTVDIEAHIKMNDELKLTEFHVLGNLVFNKVAVPNLFGLPLTQLNGSVDFQGNRTNFKNLSVQYGKSDALLNGYVELATGKINNRARIKLDIESSLINLDEILKLAFSPSDSSSKKDFFPLYSVNLKMRLDTLHFMKFTGIRMNADLLLDENIININNLSTQGMGGHMRLAGSVTHQFNGDYYVKAKVKTQHVDLDSLFYVFGNFKQDFITAEAIKGDLDAEIFSYMYFGYDGSFKRNLLYTQASLLVKNGELNNFKPIMSLASYLNEKGENLAKLRFNNLANKILIKNDTIYISSMNVETNIRNIKIGGYHTLNQQIDYRLAVPVINRKRDSDQKFGNVKTNNSGELYFPFRIKGTTTDYKVTYDLKTASSNFVKGIGNVLHGKQKDVLETDSLKIEEEEFFDWDNN